MRIMMQIDDLPPKDIQSTPWAAYADVITTIAIGRTKSGRLRGREARENAVLRWSFPAHRPPFDDVKINGDAMVINAFSTGMSDEQIAVCLD